ncbi:MAG TPA: IclR family transcriptional regulator [Caldilineae bacterium]|jgi:DNA-binding IclR family transcriptional regulator|nr:IclR family transcriptional regulator [Caldilineae bacterium]
MINSVLKAIDILQTFTPDQPRLTLGEISDKLGMPKGTVHNLLSTLLARGFIEKTDDGRYALGTAIIPLTQAVRINVELRDRAAPLLRELANTCRESVYLTVLDGDYGLYIYAIESPRRLLARTAVGERVALHCTSVGKAILSKLPIEEVEGIIQRVGLPRFTEATITDPDTLYKELEETRARGYAIDRGEHEKGLYCVGAPILRHDGRVIGACSVSGANPEMITSRVTEFAARVMYTAQEISRRMGYVPASPSLVVDAQSIPPIR